VIPVRVKLGISWQEVEMLVVEAAAGEQAVYQGLRCCKEATARD